MRIPPEALKQIVLGTGLVTEKDYSEAAAEAKRTGRDVLDILISRGKLTEEYAADLVASYFNVPRVDLRATPVDEAVLNMIPEDIARSRMAVVFGKTNNTLQVAMVDPGDLETQEFLERFTGKKLEIYLATESDLRHVFAQYRKIVLQTFQKVIEEQLRQISRLRIVGEGADLAKLAAEVPVVSIVDNIISYAASLNASDVHIELFQDELLLRFRIDGILREVARFAPEVHPGILARIKIMSGLQIDEHSKPQDGRIKYKRGDEIFDIRVSVMPTFYGEKIVMRLLTATLKPFSFAELGMLPDHIAIVEANIHKTFGMILSTGPTSSGKTTTQYSILNVLNRPEVNIVTVEDPIEYELRYINQTQVNPKAGITFASALRAFLRQDPNIIMVGEIRDLETADIAANAALTGHLVLSTLHTNDAPTAIPRLIDIGIPPFLVAATVNMVMAQRLVRKICTDCIESFSAPPELKELVMQQLQTSNPVAAKNYKLPSLLFRGKGCFSCNQTGYRGRLAIFEIFNVDEKIREYIVSKNFTLDGLRQLAWESGMRTMFEDGLKKAEVGITTVEEVMRVIRE
jgi:type IV pilus assembly protein PilB